MSNKLAGIKRPVHPIIERIRSDIVQRSVSLVTLGKRAGYSPETISNWLCGRSNPTLGAASDVAEALGCDIKLVKRGE